MKVTIHPTGARGYGHGDPCCSSKKVGDVNYKLVSESDTSAYGCEESCIYETVDKPGETCCFKAGDLPITCLSGGEEMSEAVVMVMEAREERENQLNSVMEKGLEEWEKRPNMTVMEEMMQDGENSKQELEALKSFMAISTYTKGMSSR